MLPLIFNTQSEELFLKALSERFGSTFLHSPDTYILAPDEGTITIEQIRSLTKTALLGKAMKYLVIMKLESATPVALQALLKTVEEQHERIGMVFWCRSLHQLPAPFLSRCSVISLKQQETEIESGFELLIEKIKKSTPAGILAEVSDVGASREEAMLFFQKLCATLHKKGADQVDLLRSAVPALELYQLFFRHNLNSQLAVDLAMLKIAALIKKNMV